MLICVTPSEKEQLFQWAHIGGGLGGGGCFFASFFAPKKVRELGGLSFENKNKCGFILYFPHLFVPLTLKEVEIRRRREKTQILFGFLLDLH